MKENNSGLEMGHEIMFIAIRMGTDRVLGILTLPMSRYDTSSRHNACDGAIGPLGQLRSVPSEIA